VPRRFGFDYVYPVATVAPRLAMKSEKPGSVNGLNEGRWSLWLPSLMHSLKPQGLDLMRSSMGQNVPSCQEDASVTAFW
jgi:hypothetical protein